MNNSWSKMKLGQLENFIFDLFFNFNYFHVFLVKILIIILAKIEICTYFTRKSSKVELHLSKTFFWWFSSNFAIFSCKMSLFFKSGQDIICLET